MFEQKHHIIPKSEGGTDDPSNLVECTIEEHALYHLERALKSKTQEGYSKNIRAACFIAFGQGKKFIDKMFEIYEVDAANDLTQPLIDVQEKIKRQMEIRPPYKNEWTKWVKENCPSYYN